MWIGLNVIALHIVFTIFRLQKEERMDSVATEDMFGGEDEDNTEVTDHKSKWMDQRSAGADGAHNFSPSGFQKQPGPPQNTGHRPEFYEQPMAHESFLRNTGFPEPSVFNPNFQTAGPGMPGYQQQPGYRGYPMGQGPRMMYPSTQQHFYSPRQYSGVPPYDSNPTYPTTGPLPAQGGTGGLSHGMGDLNLKQEPFPHHESFENQPEHFYDANMVYRGEEDQSGVLKFDVENFCVH